MTRNRQLGVTALGWLILLTPFAIVFYAGIRLAPVYLNYMKVAKAIDQAGNELKSGGVNASYASRPRSTGTSRSTWSTIRAPRTSRSRAMAASG